MDINHAYSNSLGFESVPALTHSSGDFFVLPNEGAQQTTVLDIFFVVPK